MNASRLREIVELLIERENKHRVQAILTELQGHLNNLVSQPQQPQYQTQFAQTLDRLRTAMNELSASFQPAQVKLLQDIGADRFFTTNLATEIDQWIQENPISPAVSQQKLTKLVSDRAAYLDDITQIRDKLDKLNVKPDPLPEGSAEIGVLIPRDLFHNHLDELIKELGVLNNILRALSEIATGAAQPIEIHQISTSDPLFLFGLDPITIAMLGGLITWALKQWKTVEEIRKLRSETQKNKSFSAEEIKSFFDSKIEESIKVGIEEKIKEILGPPAKGAGRSHEKRTELTWVLRSILARIERGMTMEVRFLPPSAPPAEDDQAKQKEAEAFANLQEIAPQLVFPSPAEKTPVLELPPPEPERPTQLAK